MTSEGTRRVRGVGRRRHVRGRRKIPPLLVLALALPVLVAHAATAQAQGQSPSEAVDPARAGETVERALPPDPADVEALKNAPQRPVTYAEVLANPDDIALNFAYAQTQIRQGRLKGAAATLERILLIAPRLAEVRLLYAFVLMRLDSLDAAERELRGIRDLPMTDAVRRQIDARLAEIDRRRKRWTAEVTLGLGTHYDWNRNSVPDDRVLFFAGLPVTLDDDSAREDDIGFIAFGRAAARYDLGTQARDEAIGSITYYQDDQVTLDTQDLQSFAVDGGYALKFPDLTVTPTAFHNTVRLSREAYYRAYGGDLNLRHYLSPKDEVTGGVRYTNEKFRAISESRAQIAQSGWRLGVRAGWQHRLSAAERLHFTGRLTYKYAHVTEEEYVQQQIEAAYVRLFEGGLFLRPGARLTRKAYRIPDTGDAPRTRVDRAIRLRLTGGAPIDGLVDMQTLPASLVEAIAPTVITVTGEWRHQISTIRNYDYDNRRAEVLVTRSWRF